MGFLTWIVLGLVAGILAKIVMPGKDPGGWIITIILGIGGAFMGGWIGGFAGMGAANGLNLPSILTATGGAIVILLIYRVAFRKG